MIARYMRTMSEELHQLSSALSSAGADPMISKQMTDILRIISPSEYLDYIEHARYESELQSCVADALQCTESAPHTLAALAGGSGSQLTRVRTAWEATLARHENRKKRRIERGVSHLEDILDGHPSELWHILVGHQGLTPPMHMMPSDSVLSRIYRESDQNPGFEGITPVKQAAEDFLATLPRELQLIEPFTGLPTGSADFLASLPKELQLPHVRNISTYYCILRLLANVKAGPCSPSVRDLDSRVAKWPLGDDYTAYWLRKALAFDMAETLIQDMEVELKPRRSVREAEIMAQLWSAGGVSPEYAAMMAELFDNCIDIVPSQVG